MWGADRMKSPTRPLGLIVLLGLLAGPVQGQRPPHLEPLPWDSYNPGAPLDRGRGVVAFSRDPRLGVVDSVAIRRGPGLEAPVVALFLQRAQEDSSPYGLQGPAGLTANLVEFGYEILGVPIDSIDSEAGWARVIYGFDAARGPQFGWVALDPAVVRPVLWRDLLPSQDLFLGDSVPWAFADRPNGSPIAFAPPLDPGDYVLHPLRVQGPWLEVRVVVPGDTCRDPVPGNRTVVAWIRYLDRAGRPRVWFYPRGC